MTPGQASDAPHGSRGVPSGSWLTASHPGASAPRPSASRSSKPRCASSASTATRARRSSTIAAELGIAKGSIFQHFGSKAGLFFETYKRAVTALPAWLDAPPKIVDQGFFAIVDYWLRRTEHLVHEDYVPYRVVADRRVRDRRPHTEARHQLRFMVSEDPYGTLDFVEYGIRRGEVRDDIDMELIVSMVDWMSGAPAGRARHRGTRSRPVPPLAAPARAPEDPDRAVRDPASERDRDGRRTGGSGGGDGLSDLTLRSVVSTVQRCLVEAIDLGLSPAGIGVLRPRDRGRH